MTRYSNTLTESFMALSERYLLEPPATPGERMRFAAELLREEMTDALNEGDPTVPVTVPPHVDKHERVAAWRALTAMLLEQPASMRELLESLEPREIDLASWFANEYASWVARCYAELGAFGD